MKIVSLILLIIILFFLAQSIKVPWETKLLREKLFEIKQGESAYRIAENLEDSGIIKSKNWFYLIVRLTGTMKELSYGQYLFDGRYNIFQVLEIIKSGDVYLKRITLPEGLTVKKACRRLSKYGFGNYDKFMSLVNDSTFAKKMTGFMIPSLEGFLYPETYLFPEGLEEEKILENMVRRFFSQTAELDFKPNEKMDFYDTIILASIVEKEAVYNDEKPTIASVYLNRIDFGMKLQADPTVAYVLELQGKSRKRIYYKDLRIKSPFNTYINKGLPPSPICSPSTTSIDAVLNPEITDYIFFFAKSKGRRHIFSQTYSQHLSRQREQGRVNAK